MKNILKTSDFFDLSKSISGTCLSEYEYPWQIINDINKIIIKISKTLNPNVYEQKNDYVYIAKSARICPNIYIDGPCIIGENTQIRPGSFIRGNVIVGDNCVIGNSTELKNSLLFNSVQVPHYNYVGDSVIGYKAHLGAGAITSNVKQDKSPISIKLEENNSIATGLRKLGAIIGDFAEIGCNSVLNPGTLIGKHSRIYPLCSVRGFVKPYCIFKKYGDIIHIKD